MEPNSTSTEKNSKRKFSDFRWPAAIVVGVLVLFLVFRPDTFILDVFSLLLILGPAFLFLCYEKEIAKKYPGKDLTLVPIILMGLGYFLIQLCSSLNPEEDFGEERPGSSFEKRKYEANFHVNAYLLGKSNQNYRLPALIRAYIRTDSSSGYLERIYKIKHMTFPNGVRISFSNTNESLSLKRTTQLRDDNGNTWYIELTNESAQGR